MEKIRLRFDHARALMRLLSEGGELAADPDAQSQHLLDGLARLVGAVAIGQLHIARRGATSRVIGSVDRGWATDSDLHRMYRFYASRGLAANPFAAELFARCRPGVALTVRREDLVDDARWYRSDFFAEVSRPSGLDHVIYSLEAGAGPVVTGLGLTRPAGDPPFDDDERNAVHFFHHELVPLLRRGAAPATQRAYKSLTPRERDVLKKMLDGQSDKEIAAALALSRYTVSQHAHSIYRKLGVSGRNELLSHQAHRASPL